MKLNEQQINFDNLVINLFIEFAEAAKANTFIEQGYNNFQNKGAYKLVLKGSGNISQKISLHSVKTSSLSLYYPKKDMHDKHFIFVDTVFAKDFYDLVKAHTPLELMPEFYRKITCVVPYNIIFNLLPQEEVIEHLKVFTNNSLITQIEPLIKVREILKSMKSFTTPFKEISDILLNLCNNNKLSFSKVETQNLLADFLELKGISKDEFFPFLKELNHDNEEAFTISPKAKVLKINKRKLFLKNVNPYLEDQFSLGRIFDSLINYFDRKDNKEKFGIEAIFINNMDNKYSHYYLTVEICKDVNIHWIELIEYLVDIACFIPEREKFKVSQWNDIFSNHIQHYKLEKKIPDKKISKKSKKI